MLVNWSLSRNISFRGILLVRIVVWVCYLFFKGATVDDKNKYNYCKLYGVLDRLNYLKPTSTSQLSSGVSSIG